MNRGKGAAIAGTVYQALASEPASETFSKAAVQVELKDNLNCRKPVNTQLQEAFHEIKMDCMFTGTVVIDLLADTV
jgi:hypothetical protein